ncbi:MAG: prolipoprotein diacylglyceryl transferase, partial [Thermoguttaceae bacterium]|nr:prolipoprotein diacylglyceryl transferase [Thermoguttaceae bacterium]
MRQTLFYLPVEILGVPLFGKGLLFWAILLAGLVAIVRALVQKKRIEDSIFYACITALGIFIVNTVGPRIAEPQGFPIRGYGVFLTLAIVLASAMTARRGKKLWNYPLETIHSIVFLAAFCGIVGARIFYVVQYWRDIQAGSFKETLVNVIDVTNGGLVVYGSIIGGIVAVVAFLLLKKLPVLATLDLFAPGLALGIAIGRIGCLMNGCCFGGPCDLPWAIVFPPESPAYTQQLDEGTISLYGITLAQPETKNAPEKNLFSIKKKRVNLASDVFAPVIVDSVDPGSEAEKAGVKSGDRICNMGIVPKAF